MLNLQPPNTDNTRFDRSPTGRKWSWHNEELIQQPGTKLKWSQCLMKTWPNGPRNHERATVMIFASGLTAASFSIMLEKLMLEKTNVHKLSQSWCLSIHYALQPYVQQTGSHWNCRKQPLPTQFSWPCVVKLEIEEPRDVLSFQTVGTASLANGCNTVEFAINFKWHRKRPRKLDLCVEFPALVQTALSKNTSSI